MHRRLSDIYQYETDPAAYLAARREIRRRRWEELIGGILLAALGGATFAFVQIAYGIW